MEILCDTSCALRMALVIPKPLPHLALDHVIGHNGVLGGSLRKVVAAGLSRRSEDLVHRVHLVRVADQPQERIGDRSEDTRPPLIWRTGKFLPDG